MIDFCFAAILAVIAFGVGKLVLDRLGQAPEAALDRMALALPLGLGFLALATLALGELGWLNRLGMSIVLGAGLELGLVSILHAVRQARSGVMNRWTCGGVSAFLPALPKRRPPPHP